MKLWIKHEITVGIGEGVARAAQHLLLTPRNHPGQRVLGWSVLGPGVDAAPTFTDAFGNRAMVVNQSKPDPEIVITAAGLIETTDKAGVVGRMAGDPVPALFTRRTALTKGDDGGLIEGLDPHTRDRIALFHTLMERVGNGTATQSQDGQSQSQSMGADHEALAHRFIGALRALSIPARYVTGYVTADEDRAAGFHAWAEAYDEGLGWVGFDCANQLCPTDQYARLAVGLDASWAAPLRSVPRADAPGPALVEVDAEQ